MQSIPQCKTDEKTLTVKEKQIAEASSKGLLVDFDTTTTSRTATIEECTTANATVTSEESSCNNTNNTKHSRADASSVNSPMSVATGGTMRELDKMEANEDLENFLDYDDSGDDLSYDDSDDDLL